MGIVYYIELLYKTYIYNMLRAIVITNNNRNRTQKQSVMSYKSHETRMYVR